MGQANLEALKAKEVDKEKTVAMERAAALDMLRCAHTQSVNLSRLACSDMPKPTYEVSRASSMKRRNLSNSS